MPVQTDTLIRGWVHCPGHAGTCPNYEQRPADVVDRETAYMFTDNGGDIPGVERAQHVFLLPEEAAADARDPESVEAAEHARKCGICGSRLEVTNQPRKTYSEQIPGAPGAIPAPPAGMVDLSTLTPAQVEKLKALLGGE